MKLLRWLAASAALIGAAVVLVNAAWRDDDGSIALPEATTTAQETTGETEPGGEGDKATTVTIGESSDSEPSYALAPTRRCLRSARFAVSAIRSDDPRLRELGDLAQRTSLELRFDGRTIGLAFGDTRLLASLLRVPDDAYRLEVRRNALLMYKPSAREEAALVRGCLRS